MLLLLLSLGHANEPFVLPLQLDLSDSSGMSEADVIIRSFEESTERFVAELLDFSVLGLLLLL